MLTASSQDKDLDQWVFHSYFFNLMSILLHIYRATDKDLGQLVFIKRFFCKFIVISGFLIVLISFFF